MAYSILNRQYTHRYKIYDSWSCQLIGISYWSGNKRSHAKYGTTTYGKLLIIL